MTYRRGQSTKKIQCDHSRDIRPLNESYVDIFAETLSRDIFTSRSAKQYLLFFYLPNVENVSDLLNAGIAAIHESLDTSNSYTTRAHGFACMRRS